MAKPVLKDMETVVEGAETLIEFADNFLLIDLVGSNDRNLVTIEAALGVVLLRRGNQIAIHGDVDARAEAERVLKSLYERLTEGRPVEAADVDAAIRMRSLDAPVETPARQLDMFPGGRMEIRTRKRSIEPRTAAQRAYCGELFANELVFGVGPAGTGKTYLAVAAAVHMFLEERIDKIILCRPAVEAGERLGFLPGTEKDKMDPYMRPLYDAIGDMLPARQVQKLMEEGRIEVAPLAFMRGRTLTNAFVVLDEAQNTTEMQMKMFLTRLGEGSRMAVTGDVTQIDLPRGTPSGLVQALKLLTGVKGIGMVKFSAVDVVRHHLVARIIEAYDAGDS